MNKKITRKAECLGRVIGFGGREDLVFTPKEIALFGTLEPIKIALSSASAQQIGGTRGFREYSDERGLAAASTRSLMRDIAEIGKALAERGIDVGAREAFRMPRKKAYLSLAASAQAFADLVEPRKALFIERGLAPNFVEALEGLVAVLSVAGTGASNERARQVGGTAGLEAEANRGMGIVRELRAIMRVKLRPTPAILAEWISMARVHTRVATDAVAPVPPPSSGSGS